MGAGANVYWGDRFTTDERSIAILEFIDSTTFTVGENSEQTIDDFVFRLNPTASDRVEELMKGVLRYVSGVCTELRGRSLEEEWGTSDGVGHRF